MKAQNNPDMTKKGEKATWWSPNPIDHTMELLEKASTIEIFKPIKEWYDTLMPELKTTEKGMEFIEAKINEKLNRGRFKAKAKLKSSEAKRKDAYLKLEGRRYWLSSVLRYNYLLDEKGLGLYVGANEVLIYVPAKQWEWFEVEIEL